MILAKKRLPKTIKKTILRQKKRLNLHSKAKMQVGKEFFLITSLIG